MLSNLKAEMVRRGVSTTDIGRTISKTERSTRDKISERFSFTIDEARRIRDMYFPGMDLDFLFQSDNIQQ